MEQGRDLMFRFAILAFITLRVTLCPLFCAASGDAARQADFMHPHMCACTADESESCSNDRVPAPSNCPCDSPFPCDSGCVCQVTPELSSRIVSTDLVMSIDFSAVCFDTRYFGNAFASHGEEQPRHFGLESGHEIRLVFASLLL